MQNLKVILCFFVFIFNSSCDPGQSLIIINESDSDLTIQFVEKGHCSNSIKYNVNRDYKESINDTTVIKLGVEETNKIDTIHFGLGTWEVHNRIDSLLLYLERIRITKKDDIITISDRHQLESLFRRNLIGKFKESIIIRIE